MKKIIISATLAVASLCTYAQSLPPTGYYRVQNLKSSRYITINDDYGSLNIPAATADMNALRTYSYDDGEVASNPASVIYALSMGDNRYDLQSQGTGANAIVSHVLQLQRNSDDTYSAFASMSGVTKYLSEGNAPKSSLNYGILTIQNYSATNQSMRWNVLPINSTDDVNYFGIKPDIQIGSDHYKAFYASFGFSFVSPGMEAFYITKVDAAKGVAVYKKVEGTVPQSTPVYVKCASAQPAGNRLDILFTEQAGIEGNALSGVFFCNTPNDAFYSNPDHVRCEAYDESTMRLLGVTSKGTLGFVKATDAMLRVEVDKNTGKTMKYLPANTAYLKVASNAPAELRLVSEEEYESVSTVTVTAKNISRVYGEPNPTFEYTADGTFTGQPELKCEATATSPVGTYPITVGQGTVTDANIVGVAGTLTINAAPLTVTAQAASRTYGDDNPTLTFTYSGWKNGETDAVLTTKPSATTTATKTSPAGQYDITVGGGAAKNYTLNYVTAKLTVNAAALTVKADDKTRMEGTDNPELTVSYSGFKNGETEAVLDTKPTASTTATKDSAPGTYPITVAGGSAKNYTLSYQSGTLTVTAGTLTLTAKSYTREYGEENPAFEFDHSGTAVLRGTPAITCAATKASPVGVYDIVIAQGTVENENVTYVNGKLTITAAPLTVKADDATREFGQANPVFTVSYSGWKNGDNEDVLTVKPVAQTVADETSKVGTYDITVDGGKAENYSFIYVNGTLTVTEKVIIVNDKENENTETLIVNEDGNATFTYVEPAETAETVEKVEIPETVSDGEEEYTVTKIAEEAFKGQTTIESVVIPSTIVEIGADAFAGCTGLKKLYVNIEEPISLLPSSARGMNEAADGDLDPVFSGVDKETCILYVPIGSKVKYEAAPVWNTFKNIVEIDIQGIADAVFTAKGSLDVYDLSGRKVRSSATSLDGLSSGVYVVNGKKIAVK